MNAIYVTSEGLKKMQEELEALKANRLVIAARIGEAKEQGDLSENAEYQAVRDEQSLIESRIIELEDQIKSATLIKHHESEEVRVGSTVVVEINKDKNNLKTFYIVGVNEADPSVGKISNESPVAQALLNHVVGDEVQAKTPAGNVNYKIISVE